MILTALSFVVALATVWNLRMTGVTIANDATCGYTEHSHSDECLENGVQICTVEEHIHKIACYSDPDADVETSDVWEATLPTLTGNKGEDIVLIAQSQIGYTESERNYEVSEDGEEKNGITRYGQWYGNPYGDWENMFVAFCLRYAGVSEKLINSGAFEKLHKAGIFDLYVKINVEANGERALEIVRRSDIQVS